MLRSLYRDEDWHQLVRSFIKDHRCSSPYFLEISQEFIQFLMHDYNPRPLDPPFLVELAHYEWVELVLDVATDSLPDRVQQGPPDLLEQDPLSEVPVLSPLAWSLRYCFPVHEIGPGIEPDEAPEQATYLIVYRNRAEEVKFMESNAATARLLELIKNNETQQTGQVLLEQLAAQMNADSVTSVVDFGARMLRQFQELDIIPGCRQ